MQYVPVEQLHEHWPRVRQQVQVLNQRYGERTTPEELYHALRQGMAALYAHGQGFLVLQSVTELNATKSLFVWLACGKFADDQDLLVAELHKLAATLNAKRIRMRSPRKWERAMKDYWRVYEYIYEHELETPYAQAAD